MSIDVCIGSLQRRVLACLRAWDQMSVYHFNVIDKLRETFIGRTSDELEKQKAFVSETISIRLRIGKSLDYIVGCHKVLYLYYTPYTCIPSLMGSLCDIIGPVKCSS